MNTVITYITMPLCVILLSCQATIVHAQMMPWSVAHDAGYNHLPATTTMATFPSEDDRNIVSNPSNNITSLNGTWDFKLTTAEEATKKCISDPQSIQWDNITVPGNWSTQGILSIDYPNSTPSQSTPSGHQQMSGVYHKELNIKSLDPKSDYLLHISSICSKYQIYVNGLFVGSDVDLRLSAEYLLSKYLQVGINHIIIRVSKSHPASLTEPKPQWLWSGIDGDVSLTKRPKIRIEDLLINTTPNHANTKALLSIEMSIRNTENKDISQHQISIHLQSDTESTTAKPIVHKLTMEQLSDQQDKVRLDIENPELWSAVSPALYSLVVAISDESGKVLESIYQKVGLRRLTWDKGMCMVNGQSITLRGVNYQTHDYSTGSMISSHQLEEDIQLMKRNHINAVRTKPPVHPYFYDLCDKYGIYVMSGISNVTKQTNNHMSTIEKTSTAIQSMTRSLANKKNHPSIIAWSMGQPDEDWSTKEINSAWLQYCDPQRLVFSELNVDHTSKANQISNTNLTRQPSVDKNQTDPYLEQHPTHPVVYTNDNTSPYTLTTLDSLLSSANKSTSFIGGFYYDWLDLNVDTSAISIKESAVSTPQRSGAARSLNNNLLTATRTQKSRLMDLNKLFQPIQIRLDNDKVTLSGNASLPPVASYDIHLKQLQNGVTRKDTIVNLQLERNGSYELEYFSIPKNEAYENILEVSITSREILSWTNEEFEIAWEQFILNTANWEPAEQQAVSKVDTVGSQYMVYTEDLIVTADQKDGSITISQANGSPVTIGAIRPTYWNSALEQVRSSPTEAQDTLWKNPTFTLNTLRINKGKRIFSMYTQHTIGDTLATQKTLYQIYDLNSVYVKVDIDFNPNVAKPRRSGMEINLPIEYDSIAYYGRGPLTTSEQINRGSRFGIYHQTAEETRNNINAGADSGMRYDIRWLDLMSADERITIERHLPISASFVPYQEAQYMQPLDLAADDNKLKGGKLVIEHCANTAKKKNALKPTIAVTQLQEDDSKFRYDFNLSYKLTPNQ